MSTANKKPLKRKTAIFVAILLMWLVGGISLGLIHSAYDWNFILLGGYDFATLGQIGGYYLARFGSQIMGLGLAAFVISKSDFLHPARAACVTAMVYYGITTAIRMARNPWSVAPNLDQSIPVLAELAQLILMIGFIGLFTRFVIWLSHWLETGPLARYAHH
jgi:hypothetical protein